MFVFSIDDLRAREEPVTVGNARYTLREALAGAAARFRNARAKAGRFTPQGKFAGFDGIAEAELQLLADCLQRHSADGNPLTNRDGSPVTEDVKVVATWPDRVTIPLVDWVKKNSPTLADDESAESIEKQIEALNERLQFLRENAEKKG